MKFKIGDKVTFLNEKLDGTVTNVYSTGIVKVAIEDGFEIDVMENELAIVLMDKTQRESIFKKEEDTLTKEIVEDAHDILSIENTLQWIVMPADTESINNGMVECGIANGLNCKLYFVLSRSVNNHLQNIGAGQILENSFVTIAKFERAEMLSFNFLKLEILFCDTESKKYRKPVITVLSIELPGRDTVDLKLKGRFAFAKRKMIVNENIKELSTSELQHLVNTKTITSKEPVVVSKPAIAEIIVDLHTEAMEMKTHHLSNEAILEIQLDNFRRSLNDAIFKKYWRIIFIHGVGEGVLKNKIRDELKHYKDLKVSDADFKEFGVGATAVILS